MSTTNKLKGWVKNDAPEWMKRKGNVGLLFANATNAHLSFPATLVLHGSGEHKEVFTQADIDAAVRLTLQRVRNMNAAGAAIAELISKEHNIPL